VKKCERLKNLRKIHVIRRRKFHKKLNEIVIKMNEINNTKTTKYYSQEMKEKLIHKKKKELKKFIINQLNPGMFNKKYLLKLLSIIKPFRKIYEKVLKIVDKLANNNNHSLLQINGKNVSINISFTHNTSEYQNFLKNSKKIFIDLGSVYNTSIIDLNRTDNGDLIYNDYKENSKFKQIYINKHVFDKMDKTITIKGLDSKRNQTFFDNSLGYTGNLEYLRGLILNSTRDVNIKVINSTKAINPRKLMITIIKNFIESNENIYDKKDTPKLIEYVGKILQNVSNKSKTINLTANSFLKFIVNITKKLSKLYKKRILAIFRGNDNRLKTLSIIKNLDIIDKEDKSLNRKNQNDKF